MALYEVDGLSPYRELSNEQVKLLRELGHLVAEKTDFVRAHPSNAKIGVSFADAGYTRGDKVLGIVGRTDNRIVFSPEGLRALRDKLNEFLIDTPSADTEITADSPEPDRHEQYLDCDGYKWRFDYGTRGWQFKHRDHSGWMIGHGYAWDELPDSGDASFPWVLAS